MKSENKTWEHVLCKLEESLFIAEYMLISNPENINGTVIGNKLVLRELNPELNGLLCNLSDKIREAANIVFGEEVNLEIRCCEDE